MTRQPMVLIVEDNEMNRDILIRRIQKMGFATLAAVDGIIGLRVAMESSPDLIIMDVNLPGMDGIQVTQTLKADPRTKHIPILVLTAHARIEERAPILKSGCDDFDTKPVDFDRLKGKIFSLLKLPVP